MNEDMIGVFFEHIPIHSVCQPHAINIALRRSRLNAISEAVHCQYPTEKRAQNAIEGVTGPLFKVCKDEKDEGGAPPLQGGSYVAFKAPLRRARSTLTDALALVSHTYLKWQSHSERRDRDITA